MSTKLTVTFVENCLNQVQLAKTKKLGEGKSEVFHVTDTCSSDEFALKIFTKNDSGLARYRRERLLIAPLSHPNIIKYHHVLDHNATFDILLTEYAHNGDFFNFVIQGALDDETYMRTYFHQLISGLEYLHSQEVAHMDLKLDNLLLTKDFILKITDFDQSHLKGEELLACPGTNGYRAPEVINKNCTNIFAADIYSAGIILFAFKARQFPFVEIEEDDRIKLASYDLFVENNEKFWQTKTKNMNKKSNFFCEDFKKLVNGMLEKDPSKRMTIAQIKASEWYNKPILSPEGLTHHMSMASKKLDSK